MSPFQDIPVPIFGKEHFFPAALYQHIQPATPDDVSDIASLSTEMPLIYKGDLLVRYLPFRHPEAYARLIQGEDVKALARKRQHLIYVFKDEDERVVGYVHGTVYLETEVATVDELVVHESWQGRGVARALLGRLLHEFSRRDKTSVQVLSRSPLPESLIQPYGILPRGTGFDISLVVDHLISRFSLNYLMFQDFRHVTLFADRAREIKEAIRAAKREDHLKTGDTMKYLTELILPLDRAVIQKLLDHKEHYYAGIQDDKMEVANYYFLMYLLSGMAEEDDDPRDKAYTRNKGVYFNSTIYEMRAAQRQGGQYPADIQIFISRLHAFARLFEQEVKGSPQDLAWVRKSLLEYLRLIDLKEIGGQSVYVFPGKVESALREILWFRYPYGTAQKIADFWMKQKRELEKLFKLDHLGVWQKEEKALASFEELRRKIWEELKIKLEPEFGLLYLYLLPLYSEEDKSLRHRLRQLFSQASFYQYDAPAQRWVERSAVDLTRLLTQSAAGPWKFSEDREGASLNQNQTDRLIHLLQELSRAFDPISGLFVAAATGVETAL